MGEWQPIETAPKDGTRILLYFRRDDSMVFRDPTEIGMAVGAWWSPHSKDWWLTCMWASSSAHREPFAWMPLPEPPPKEARSL